MPNLEAYMKSFWAYGIYGWLLEWIKRGMQESGKELETLFVLARQNKIHDAKILSHIKYKTMDKEFFNQNLSVQKILSS